MLFHALSLGFCELLNEHRVVALELSNCLNAGVVGCCLHLRPQATHLVAFFASSLRLAQRRDVVVQVDI